MSFGRKLGATEPPTELYGNLDASSIRLLEILPSANANGMITCRLIEVALSSDPIYVALSYRWGSSSDTAEIVINGHSVIAQSNLASALRQIRNRSPQSSDFGLKLLWADAICINQGDTQEKTRQVQLMGTIYAKASMVISWLGPDHNNNFLSAIKAIRSFGDEAKLSSAWLKDLSWMKKYPWLIEIDSRNDEGPNEMWRSLRCFLSDPYWGRVWILQEMALASNLQVMTRSDLVPYRNIECAIEMIESFGQRSGAWPTFIPNELQHFLAVPGRFDVSYFIQVKNFQQYVGHIDQMGDAEKLEGIMSTWTRHSTAPLDKVYAVQGLLQNFIYPDYDKTPSDVYCDFASKWVALTGDLDILRFSGKAFDHPTLPVPLWHLGFRIGTPFLT